MIYVLTYLEIELLEHSNIFYTVIRKYLVEYYLDIFSSNGRLDFERAWSRPCNIFRLKNIVFFIQKKCQEKKEKRIFIS